MGGWVGVLVCACELGSCVGWTARESLSDALSVRESLYVCVVSVRAVTSVEHVSCRVCTCRRLRSCHHCSVLSRAAQTRNGQGARRQRMYVGYAAWLARPVPSHPVSTQRVGVHDVI